MDNTIFLIHKCKENIIDLLDDKDYPGNLKKLRKNVEKLYNYVYKNDIEFFNNVSNLIEDIIEFSIVYYKTLKYNYVTTIGNIVDNSFKYALKDVLIILVRIELEFYKKYINRGDFFNETEQ